MATIKDVAKLAGVSVSTVSRTLSEKIFVDTETKKRVLQAVEQLNYRPNPLAKGLKEGKTGMLALMIPDIANLYYPRIVGSIEKYVVERGYSLLLYNTNESVEREKEAVATLKRRYADGVIAITVSSQVEHVLELEKEKIPFVFINRLVEGEVNWVSNDHYNSAYAVMRQIINSGHTKICAQFRSFDNTIYRARYEGCVQALKDTGLQCSERYFLFDVNTIEQSKSRAMELLQKEDRPSAIFAGNDMLTFGVYSAADTLGLLIPEDVSVVGYDNIPVAPYLRPPLTTYDQPLDEIGREAVRILINQIEGKADKPEQVCLLGEMKVRSSLGHYPTNG